MFARLAEIKHRITNGGNAVKNRALSWWNGNQQQSKELAPAAPSQEEIAVSTSTVTTETSITAVPSPRNDSLSITDSEGDDAENAALPSIGQSASSFTNRDMSLSITDSEASYNGNDAEVEPKLEADNSSSDRQTRDLKTPPRRKRKSVLFSAEEGGDNQPLLTVTANDILEKAKNAPTGEAIATYLSTINDSLLRGLMDEALGYFINQVPLMRQQSALLVDAYCSSIKNVTEPAGQPVAIPAWEMRKIIELTYRLSVALESPAHAINNERAKELATELSKRNKLKVAGYIGLAILGVLLTLTAVAVLMATFGAASPVVAALGAVGIKTSAAAVTAALSVSSGSAASIATVAAAAGVGGGGALAGGFSVCSIREAVAPSKYSEGARYAMGFFNKSQESAGESAPTQVPAALEEDYSLASSRGGGLGQ